MGSLNIRFNDEYPKQTTYRHKFVNTIRSLLKEEPDLLGTEITITTTGFKGKSNSYKYKSGRFQTEKIDELEKCSRHLKTQSQFNPHNEVPIPRSL
tara:strand:- start:78 stop:365 length:288 start_codon:yes stop_codon:yes gene_type:complete